MGARLCRAIEALHEKKERHGALSGSAVRLPTGDPSKAVVTKPAPLQKRTRDDLDAIARLVPGVIEPASLAHESHTGGVLEGPQYTRPPQWEGRSVPAILLSGDHVAIAKWRRAESVRRTVERRPDLVDSADLTPAERVRLPRPAAREPVADEDLRAAYQSGVGSYRIAARFGISPATVRSRLRSMGVRLRAPRTSVAGPSPAEVARLRATGLSARELARHFGVSHVTILSRLKQTSSA